VDAAPAAPVDRLLRARRVRKGAPPPPAVVLQLQARKAAPAVLVALQVVANPQPVPAEAAGKSCLLRMK
jgi:hypothetical protein